MTRAVSRAASITSLRPPRTTRDTNPSWRASREEKGRAVYASSEACERLPESFGRRASVPMSAASPTSTSLMQNVAASSESAEAYRMSQAQAMSTPSPKTTPCAARMTGCRHRSMEEMEDWNLRMCSRSCRALRAGSVGEEGEEERMPASVTVALRMVERG